MLERVAAVARKADPAKAGKAVLAAPFYVVGAAVGLLWFCLTWAWAAVVVGFSDGTRKPGS
jgi:hypothetical protein